jgi:hypothetical protein
VTTARDVSYSHFLLSTAQSSLPQRSASRRALMDPSYELVPRVVEMAFDGLLRQPEFLATPAINWSAA